VCAGNRRRRIRESAPDHQCDEEEDGDWIVELMKKKNTVRVHRCVQRSKRQDAVSVHRQQEKEGSVRVHRITKEEAR